MPYNRRQFRAPVRHNKEIFDGIFIGVAAATTTVVQFAASVNDYTGGIGTCPISAKIKAVFIDVSYTSGTEVPARMDWYVCKVPAAVATMPIPGATGGTTRRKYILLERKGLNNTVGAGTGNNPRAAAGWLMIPKRFQNMAEGDVLEFHANGSTLYDLCTKFIYKWVA